MKDALLGLFASRKFVAVVLGTLVAAGLAVAKVIPADQFVTTLRDLVMVLVGAIGVEGAAEKLYLPPRPSVPPEDPNAR